MRGSWLRRLAAQPRQQKGLAAAGGLLCLCLLLPSSTESAVANGDTRTLYLYHAHTGESIDATYRVDGHYDPAVLEKLNWFLRDWRRDEETNMDPRLFDAVWETYRSAGASDRIVVLCGYRSPQTNAMLRRRSRSVAQHSQHMLGKAMDTTMPGISMEKIREYAMRLQMGGVGYYPSANFVHIDVGGVRAWPRMSYDELVRLFPDGKTVHIAADGRTLPGYDEARAELEENGSVAADVPPPPKSQNFFAWLFGLGSGGEDEHEDADTAAAPAQPAANTYVADAADNSASATAAAGDTAADNSASANAAAGDTAADNSASDASSDDSGSPVATQASDGQAADDAESAQASPAAEVAPPAPVTPMPPPRPRDLAELAAASPPQLRPTQVALAELAPQAEQQKDTTFFAASAQELPGIITQGPNDGRATESFGQSASTPQALAYAPVGQMEGLRSAARDAQDQARAAEVNPGVVAARLDQSNFRSLTQSTETAEIESQTIFGPTLAGLRRAAQVETAELSGRLESDYVARFGVTATNLAADRFAGPSVASLDTDKTLTAFDDTADLQPGD